MYILNRTKGAKTSAEIDKIRNGYRPAALRGAVLFFVLFSEAFGLQG